MTDTKQDYKTGEAEKIKLSMADILKTENIANLLDDNQQTAISKLVMDSYDVDIEQSSDHIEDNKKFMALAMQADVIALEQGTGSKYNNSIPLLIKAAIRFYADAFPVLTKGGRIARFKPVGDDSDLEAKDENDENIIDQESGRKAVEDKGGEKLKTANRLSIFLNYILRKKMKGWNKELGRLLLTFAITGTIYRKTYFNSITRLPDSKLIDPNNLVINPSAKNMEDYPVSEILYLTPNEVTQRMNAGLYTKYSMKDLSYTGDGGNESYDSGDERKFSEENQPIQLIEQHCLLDLDGDGFKEPYIVSVSNGGSKLLSIIKRYAEKDIKKAGKGDKIIDITAKNFYTPFIFMPNPQGTFHGMGLGSILYKSSLTINSSLNQLLKSAFRANMERGFFDKDRINFGQDVIKLEDGQFQGLEVSEGSINDAFADFPAKEPSAGLFNLLTFLLDIGKEMSNINDIMTGDFPANAAPGTVLAMIQQGMKEFKVIYTNVYESLEQELYKIFEIIAEHPEDFKELYVKILDDSEVNFEKDFDLEAVDVMPSGDREVVLDSEKMAKGSFLMQFVGNQDIIQHTLLKKIFESFTIEDIDDLIKVPQPNAPDPVQVAMERESKLDEAKVENEKKRIKLAASELNNKVATAAANAEKQDVEIDKMESEVELNKAKSIKTLAEAGQEANLAEAEKLYEPETKK